MAKLLVVGVVVSLNTPSAGGLRWFRVFPCPKSCTSGSSVSAGSSSPEGVISGAMTEVELLQAGFAGSGVPAEERDVGAGRCRVRCL